MSDSRGFTLIEVLLTGALLAIALIPVANVIVTSYSALDRAGEQTAAVALCEQRMEWLRNQAFTSANLTAGSSTETLTGTYAGYTRTTTIVDDTPRSGVKTITVQTASPAGVQVTVASRVTS